MENNANQLNQNLCKKNCGFFGSSAFDGYCSKCYKDHVKRQNSGTAAGVLQSNLNSSSTNILTTTTTTATDIPNTIDSTTTTTTTTISNNEPIGVDNVETPQQPQVVLPDNAIEIDNQQPTVTFTLQQEEQEPQQVKQQPEQQLLQAQPIAVDEASSSSQDMSPVASSGDLTSANDNKTKKKTRCMVDTCRRKVGLTGFDCRCGGLYCGEHRYSDKHNCNFDYKQHGQDQIRKNNPIVVGEKIQKL